MFLTDPKSSRYSYYRMQRPKWPNFHTIFTRKTKQEDSKIEVIQQFFPVFYKCRMLHVICEDHVRFNL